MTASFRLLSLIALCILAGSAAADAPATAPASQPASQPTLILQKGDRLVIIGDSITEQKVYSRYMEGYLIACTPELDVTVVQLGWSGETAAGFLKRMDMDLLPLKPTIITTCYGMNDGGYKAYKDAVGQSYGKAMAELIQRAQTAGARVMVGSPGAVDSDSFHGSIFVGKLSAADYNESLGKLGEIDRQLAQKHGAVFADVHGPLMKTMAAAKAALGDKYLVCGNDGVHPGYNGHLVMAYAMLKAMGLSGQIATIDVDLASGAAKAGDGHKILSAAGGKIEIESARYPFCFIGDAKAPDSTVSILPFLPFSDDLNRFELRVAGLKADTATVTWGDQSRKFTRQQLEQGVNLAKEFAGQTPFQQAFEDLDHLVARKQAMETTMIKVINHTAGEYRSALAGDAEGLAAFDLVLTKVRERHEAMQKEVRSAVVPIKHTITITAE